MEASRRAEAEFASLIHRCIHSDLDFNKLLLILLNKLLLIHPDLDVNKLLFLVILSPPRTGSRVRCPIAYSSLSRDL